MKYCWSFSNEVGLGGPVAAFGAILCIGSFVIETFRSVSPILYIARFGVLTFLSTFVLLLVAFVSTRRYEIQHDGITLYYPLGIKKKIHWREFSEIALCKVHYAAWSTEHIVAIRCVVGTEKHGPKQATVAKEWWSRIEYEIIYFPKVISIYKTEERIAEFHKFCPHRIFDYRNLEDCS